MSRKEEKLKEGWNGQRGEDKLPTADYYRTTEGKRTREGWGREKKSVNRTVQVERGDRSTWCWIRSRGKDERAWLIAEPKRRTIRRQTALSVIYGHSQDVKLDLMSHFTRLWSRPKFKEIWTLRYAPRRTFLFLTLPREGSCSFSDRQEATGCFHRPGRLSQQRSQCQMLISHLTQPNVTLMIILGLWIQFETAGFTFLSNSVSNQIKKLKI